MLGTLVNTGAVIAGGCIGLLCKKGIRESWTQSINKALGAAVAVIGINGVIANMFTVSEGKLSSSGELLLVISLVIGTLVGELLRLDDRLNAVSGKIEKRFHMGGFASSFMNATILFCVGAMAIVGSIQDGLTGDASVLYIKSALDFVSAIIFGATLGVGVVFSCLPVLVYQGTITLLAGLLSGFLVGELLAQVCMVGYTIILCIGVNFLATTRIKTLNMLPALLVPIAWNGIQNLIAMLQG